MPAHPTFAALQGGSGLVWPPQNARSITTATSTAGDVAITMMLPRWRFFVNELVPIQVTIVNRGSHAVDIQDGCTSQDTWIDDGLPANPAFGEMSCPLSES
ncbi:MAG: hypothetical protein ACRDGS_07090, partial [Chloroflexota bacterium]